MTEQMQSLPLGERVRRGGSPDADAPAKPSPGHIIVVGNQKGGTGKSTAAMHLIVGLLRQGRTVASVDLDAQQASLSRYVEKRRRFVRTTGTPLRLPDHHRFAPENGGAVAPVERERRLAELLDRLAATHEFVVVDCPGSQETESRYAVSRADTLITPMNDSFVDLDLLARVEGTPPRIMRVGPYGEMVWQQKKRRAGRDGGRMDWIVLRNRHNVAASRNRKVVGEALEQLSGRLGFRLADGFGERVVFRELFVLGLTMLDFRSTEPMIVRSPSHAAAHREARALVALVRERLPAERAPAPPLSRTPPSPPPSSTPSEPARAEPRPPDGTPADWTPAEPTPPESGPRPGPAPAADADGRRRHVLVIYNPVAGGRRQRRFRAALRHMAVAGCAVAVLETGGRGEAEALARASLDEEFDAIVAAGGDGTVNEVANALAGSDKVMGILPLGTLNVLARELGLPADPVRAARLIVAGGARRVHLGRVGERRFSVACGVGLDAHVVARVTARWKQYFGRSAYVLQTLLRILRYRPARYAVTIAGETVAAAAVVVSNGRCYAGRLACAPEARVDEARLHVCLFLRPGRWNLLRYRLAMAMGRLERLKDVEVVPADAVEIDGDGGEPVHADGEIVARLPVRINVARESLMVLAPE